MQFILVIRSVELEAHRIEKEEGAKRKSCLEAQSSSSAEGTQSMKKSFFINFRKTTDLFGLQAICFARL